MNKSTSTPASLSEILQNRTVAISLNDHPAPVLQLSPVAPSPCTQACPAGVNVKAYVSLIAAGKFQAALEVVRDRNPFPGICGRICTHPCEAACNRNEVDAPVAVCWLKRFVADYELAQGDQPLLRKPLKQTKPKVAVIGAGPAGLTAAADLARLGYRVTVLEALSEPGGMLVAGIPAYRLPRDILKVEIDAIRKLGVRIKTGTRVCGTRALSELLKKGYAAVFVAAGAQRGKKLQIPGEEDFTGVIDCVQFLNEVNLGSPRRPGNKVIIIGGGNSALDSARTALRLGCSEVQIVYRRTRREMPANAAEIQAAEVEGIKSHYLAAPVEILGKNGKVTGMRCQKMKLGEPDSSGRRRPVPIDGSEFEVAADAIIAAISQEPDLDFCTGETGLEITRWNTLEVDPETLQTSLPGIFAGGDVTTGPGTVIDAIAAGHRAAAAITRHLEGKPLKTRPEPDFLLETEAPPELTRKPRRPRAEMPVSKIPDRIKGFDEVELGFNEAAAVAEAQRCLRCGPCNECVTCVSDCDKYLALLSLPEYPGEILYRIPPESSAGWNTRPTREGVLHLDPENSLQFRISPLVPRVQEDACRACGDCRTACEYQAIDLLTRDGKHFAHINPHICRGCGTCVSVCPNSAIATGYFTTTWLEERLADLDPTRPNIVVFSCRWNGSRDHDLLPPSPRGTQYNLIFIRLMCSGQIETSQVLRALERGAAGVFLAGCADGDCHYEFGNSHAARTFERTRNMISILGIDPRRLHFEKLNVDDSAALKNALSSFKRKLPRLSRPIQELEPLTRNR